LNVRDLLGMAETQTSYIGNDGYIPEDLEPCQFHDHRCEAEVKACDVSVQMDKYA
jgi:hypothetical protein